MRRPLILSVHFFVLAATVGTQEPDQPPPAKVRYEDLPAAIRLGLRAEAIQKNWAAAPTVVIVPDGGSYAAAISKWSPPGVGSSGLRFPVLIDDGSAEALEDIARFVRGFAPSAVIRWSSGGDGLPKDAAERRKTIEMALLHAWEPRDPGQAEAPDENRVGTALSIWKKLGVPRTGIVIAADDDPAWTAALALSAGRAQPLAWVDRPPPGRVDSNISAPDLRKFEAAIEKACESTNLAWSAIGDDIDAVTVCMASPNRVQAEPSLILATMDCLGRKPGEENQRVGKEDRWAWTGQVFGTESHSAYLAMCSLFLAPKKAWLFDGYIASKPWSDFDATAASVPLKKAGLETTVDDTPNTSEKAWRTRAAKPVDAGLITVNTKGLSNHFNLEPGQCLPGDAPELTVPSILYFVHSWSAFAPTEHWTVGGRWVDRGVYSYLGSVDEPYLQAFIPTPGVTDRLAAKFPMGAAIRFDNGAAWKLTLIGDPLTMIHNAVPLSDSKLPFDETTDLKADLRAALSAKDYDAVMRNLVLQGRDKDAARLAKGLLDEDAKSLSPKAAQAAILPLFRAGEHETMMKVYATLPAQAAASLVLRDALWLAAYRILPTTSDSAVLGALRTAIREDSRVRDSLELAEPYSRVFGHDAAVGLLEEAKSHAKESSDRSKLDQEIRRLSGIRNRSR